MNKEAISKVADEIVFFDYLEKKAGADLKKYHQQINQAFIKYITNRMFPLGTKKVPYNELPIKDKEKVWSKFWDEIGSSFRTIEKEVEDTIQKMRAY